MDKKTQIIERESKPTITVADLAPTKRLTKEVQTTILNGSGLDEDIIGTLQPLLGAGLGKLLVAISPTIDWNL
jgi:hypothetical protein